jgi:inner membrane protein
MDSLTQIVLGAGMGELLMGRKIGNKAILLGAIAGTVPDLDVIFTSMCHDPFTKLEIHRAYSHALFTHVFLAIPFAYLCYILFKKAHSFMSFYWLWFLGFATHALLDGFTTYGTMMFLPFSNFLYGLNNISIIDPLYTLPFMGLLIWCMFYKKDDPKRHKIALWSIYISTAYMLLTFGFKYIAHQHFEGQLQAQNIKYDNLHTSPTIFNTILWAGTAVSDSDVYVSEYSLAQSSKETKFGHYKRNLNEMKEFECKELNIMKWFSQNEYFVERPTEDSLLFFNIKWGRGDFTKTDAKQCFMFYTIFTKTPEGIKATMLEPNFKDVKITDALGMMWRRMWE